MSQQQRQRAAPKWVSEEVFVQNILQALLQKLEKGKQPKLTIRKGGKLFKPLYEFSNKQSDYLWALLQALEHEYQLITLMPRKVQPKPWEEVYEGATVQLNNNNEALLRHWLGAPAFDPYRLTWQEAIKQHEAVFAGNLATCYDNPLTLPGRSAADVVAALVRVAERKARLECGKLMSLRELSATCFWGNSKYLEQHKSVLELYFPGLLGTLAVRPLLVEAYVPEQFSAILFIENQDTFLKACRGEFAACRHAAIIYSAGFRIGNQKGRGKNEAVFAYVNASSKASEMRFEDWWFQRNESISAVPTYFWGDLDYAGMGILASLRQQFPELEAWQPAYQVMSETVAHGAGHMAKEAGKVDQIDPGATGCQYADSVLLPLMREQQAFLDQEWYEEK